MESGTKQGSCTGNGAGKVEKSDPLNTVAQSKRVRARRVSASTMSEQDILCLLQEALHLWSKTSNVTIQGHNGILAILVFPPDGSSITYNPTIASIVYNGEAISDA